VGLEHKKTAFNVIRKKDERTAFFLKHALSVDVETADDDAIFLQVTTSLCYRMHGFPADFIAYHMEFFFKYLL